MLKLETSSEIEMISLGRLLGERAQPGDLLFLSGELGAGKTTLTKGIAQGLGIKQEITSPTFQLLKSYQGRYPLHHLDLYRLTNQAELAILEPEELVQDGITVVEWGDLLLARLNSDYLAIRIDLGSDLLARLVILDAQGQSYQRFLEGLTNANFRA